MIRILLPLVLGAFSLQAAQIELTHTPSLIDEVSPMAEDQRNNLVGKYRNAFDDQQRILIDSELRVRTNMAIRNQNNGSTCPITFNQKVTYDDLMDVFTVRGTFACTWAGWNGLNYTCQFPIVAKFVTTESGKTLEARFTTVSHFGLDQFARCLQSKTSTDIPVTFERIE